MLPWKPRKREPEKPVIELKPEYFYLVSYPRSGNTWLRFLLVNTFFREQAGDVTFENLPLYCPDLHSRQHILLDPTTPFHLLYPQIVKSHDPYRPEYLKVIYIARDGRDAITSYYHYLQDRTDKKLEIGDVIRGKFAYGLWSDHVTGWLDGPKEAMLFLRYEDFLDKPIEQLCKVAKFVQVDIPERNIETAVELSEFEKMQSYEEAHYNSGNERPSSYKKGFVRKGSRGDWMTLFQSKDESLFWKLHKKGMQRGGYIE